MDDAARIRALAAGGDLDAAEAALRQIWGANARTGGARLPWAAVAEELGLLDLARAELTAALAEVPDDPEVARRLAALDLDLGLGAQAEQLPAIIPFDTPVAPPRPPEAPDLIRFVHLFGGREGVHARQWVSPDRPGGKIRQGYSPVHEPLTPALAAAHLAGQITVGAYPIRLDGTVTWAAADIDLTRTALDRARSHADLRTLRAHLVEAAAAMRSHLGNLGLPTIFEDSGYKGRHLWMLLATPQPAELIHRIGRRLLPGLRSLCPPGVSVEFFPKQARVAANGLGNLVKLPLGIHRRTNRRCPFLDEAGTPLADPWPLLRSPDRIGGDRLLEALARVRGAPEEALGEAPTEPPAAVPSPDVEPMFEGCAVLAALRAQAERTRRLTHDQQIVLTHTLGHSPGGVERLNALFARCPEVPARAFLHRPLRGHPISCARVRARIPETTRGQPCHCEFSQASHYPSPILHLPDPR